MSSPLYIETSDRDNVAIMVNDIPARTLVMGGVRARQDIPQAHKIALCDIPEDGKIIWYGVVLGYAIDPIGKGQWINRKMLELLTPPSVDEMKLAANLVTDLPKPPVDTWEGYINPNGGYAGTCNILGISTTVQRITGVLNVAAARMKSRLLPKYPNVGDTVPINHARGCGVAINAPEAKVPIRVLRNLAKHLNFGGELTAARLGCEKLTVEMLLDQAGISPNNAIILQEKKGLDDMVNSLMETAGRKLNRLNRRGRQALPLSELLIGMQCGDSNVFSGVMVNLSAGYAADMLVRGGATVLLPEVTEVRDGVYPLGECCASEEMGKKLAAEMKWYDHYLENGQVDRSTSPTPGNKKGGLSNTVEKAMGPIAKSDTSPVAGVLSPAKESSKKGLTYIIAPASDVVRGPCQLTNGIELQVFMTGRGTSYGLVIAPVIKVCSRNDMKMQWQDLIDVNAGPIATGDATIQDVGTQLFHEIVDVASGRKQSYVKKYKLHNGLCISNPAPIT